MRYYKPKWESPKEYSDVMSNGKVIGFWSGLDKGSLLVKGDLLWVNLYGLRLKLISPGILDIRGEGKIIGDE